MPQVRGLLLDATLGLLTGRGRTADPSTSLRSARDDNSEEARKKETAPCCSHGAVIYVGDDLLSHTLSLYVLRKLFNDRHIPLTLSYRQRGIRGQIEKSQSPCDRRPGGLFMIAPLGKSHFGCHQARMSYVGRNLRCIWLDDGTIL